MTPANPFNRAFGVEIECIKPKAASFSHVTADGFESVRDGSLPHRTGEEKRSVILMGQQGFSTIEALCKKLTALKYKTGDKCGLHVHVDSIGLTGKQLLNICSFINVFDGVLFSFLPECRRNNRYCQKSWLSHLFIKGYYPFESGAIKRELMAQERYYGFNTASLERHGTLEFRHHSGTLDAKKVLFWTLLCLSIVENRKGKRLKVKNRVKATKRNLERFLKLVGATPELASYLRSRWMKNNISVTNKERKLKKISA